MADNGKYCIGITYIDRMIEIGLSIFNSILFLLVVKLIICLLYTSDAADE